MIGSGKVSTKIYRKGINDKKIIRCLSILYAPHKSESPYDNSYTFSILFLLEVRHKISFLKSDSLLVAIRFFNLLVRTFRIT